MQVDSLPSGPLRKSNLCDYLIPIRRDLKYKRLKAVCSNSQHGLNFKNIYSLCIICLLNGQSRLILPKRCTETISMYIHWDLLGQRHQQDQQHRQDPVNQKRKTQLSSQARDPPPPAPLRSSQAWGGQGWSPIRMAALRGVGTLTGSPRFPCLPTGPTGP